jgi:hypothetical protein
MILKAHEAGGKLFMGDDVNVENIPRHMSGVGIYPNPVVNLAGACAASIPPGIWPLKTKSSHRHILRT